TVTRGATSALLRYTSAMATIQIRDLPEETYEVIRKRARSQGQSIQSYMRDRLVADAASPKPADVCDTVDTLRATEPTPDAGGAAADVRAIRGDCIRH